MASGCGRTATGLTPAGRSAFNEAGSPRRPTRVTRSKLELERLRREASVARRLTLDELVETYLAQHDVQPVTPVPVASRPGGRGDQSASAGLRSPAHLRDLRAPCRHLNLRPLPLHGRQPDHDRPPLRPPRRDGREHAIQLLDELNAGQRPRWTLVDARWTPERRPSVSPDNGKPD